MEDSFLSSTWRREGKWENQQLGHMKLGNKLGEKGDIYKQLDIIQIKLEIRIIIIRTKLLVHWHNKQM